MPIVDVLLDSLIKSLQKIKKSHQQNRKKRQQAKAKAAKKKTARKKTAKKKAAKKVTKKTAKKVVKKSKPKVKPKKTNEKLIGEITHYFSKIKVIVIKISAATLKVGDKIHIKGATSDFTQTIKSMQIESKDVKSARKGQVIGLKVTKQARVGDNVFLKN